MPREAAVPPAKNTVAAVSAGDTAYQTETSPDCRKKMSPCVPMLNIQGMASSNSRSQVYFPSVAAFITSDAVTAINATPGAHEPFSHPREI